VIARDRSANDFENLKYVHVHELVTLKYVNEYALRGGKRVLLVNRISSVPLVQQFQ
jgi:hypothetical protein